jgi:polysaccharide biosynthesis protein PslE
MNPSQENTSIPLFLISAARRQWGKALLFFVGSTLLIGAGTIFWGNTYRSDAKLFVRLGRESVSVDPTVPTSEAITVNEGREIEINSVLQILQSRELAKSVVDKIGATTILTGFLPEHQPPASSPSRLGDLIAQLKVLKDGRAVSKDEKAITVLLRNLKVASPRRTTVVHVQYDSASPEVAQLVVGEVIDTFKKEHARINRTEGSYEFLTEQTSLLEHKLLDAQNEMLDSKNAAGLVNVDGHQKVLQDELSLLETQLIHAKSDLSGSLAKIQSLQAAVQKMPERQEIEGVQVANDATSQMRDTLYQLQLRERELQAKYRSDHPEYKAVAEQLRNALAIYEMQSPDRDQKTIGVNASRQQLEVLLLVELANRDSLQARCDSLQQQHEATARRIKSLNADEVRLAELRRKVEQAELAFTTYSVKTEQARLEQQLESQRISNINIIQPASFVEKPASPNRLLLLVLGLMFACCGGVGVAILAEFMTSPSPKTEEQKEAYKALSPASVVSFRQADIALAKSVSEAIK